jgi:hypothetical protein
MNWSLLLPSTWNPLSAILNLSSQESQIASQALSNLFILVTVGMALAFGFWAAKLTQASLTNTGRYLNLLQRDENAIKQITSSGLPLFRQLKYHILNIANRDGSGRTSPRRTVEAAEVFRDSTLAPNFTTSRLFLAVPGILTGIGVLGTFVGLQMGIGGLDLKNLMNLETSIVPLIEGCAVAFSTSVWGVTASLLFSGLEKALGGTALRRIRKLQNRVDALIPRFVPEEAMAELERTSCGTEEILKGLAVAIGAEMQKAIGQLGGEIKDAVANATSEGQGPLMEKSAELLGKVLTTELVKFKEQIESMATQFSKQFSGASGELMTSVRNFEPTVKTLSETVGVAQRTVTEAVGKLNAHETVMEKMATAATEVRQAAEAFATMKETLQLSATRNEDAAKAQLSAAEANERVAEKFDHVGERLPEIRQTLEDAARVIASIAGPITDLKTYLERLPDDQKANEESRALSEDKRSELLLKRSVELAEKVGNAAEQFAKVGALAEKLNAAATSLDDASNELATFGSHVLDASKEQRNASEAARAAALSGERTAAALEPLPRAILDLANDLQAAGAHVKTGAEVARESYRELVKSQKVWFSGVEVGLDKMNKQLQSIIKAYGDQIEGQTRNLMNQWTEAVANCLKTYESQVGQLQGDLDSLQDALTRLKKN